MRSTSPFILLCLLLLSILPHDVLTAQTTSQIDSSDDNFFVNKLMEKYGSNGTITVEQLQSLLHNLQVEDRGVKGHASDNHQADDTPSQTIHETNNQTDDSNVDQEDHTKHYDARGFQNTKTNECQDNSTDPICLAIQDKVSLAMSCVILIQSVICYFTDIWHCSDNVNRFH